LVAVLPCSITKPIRRRILLSVSTLERVFRHVLELNETNINDAPEDEKDFLKRRKPTLTISYKDGTKYEVHDLDTMQAVIPGKGKSINSLELASRFGDLSCTISLGTYQTIQCVDVRVAGPEDKASHFAETVIGELTRDTDITVPARRLWPSAWAFGFAVAILLPFTTGAVASVKDVLALVIIVSLATLFISIPVDLFRGRWLPPVAFLWGDDGRRATHARSVITALVVSLPLWLLGNTASKFLFH